MKQIRLILAAGIYIVLLGSCGSDNSASRIVMGTSGNQIFDYSPQQYQLPFSLQVTNTEGLATGGQRVTLKVVPVLYYKGNYSKGAEAWTTTRYPVPPAAPFGAFPCNVEDANYNGILEVGEDINGNGRLDPTNPAAIGPHPENTPTLVSANQVTTDNLGNAYFSLIYPKAEANWVRVRITATTSVTGTESAEYIDIDLLASVADMQSLDTSPPSGTIPGPHGIYSDCSDPL